jgi:hypothetical protein
VHESRRWQDYCAQSSPTVLAQADGPIWPAGFAVTIEYNVPRIATGSYHNPYMA